MPSSNLGAACTGQWVGRLISPTKEVILGAWSGHHHLRLGRRSAKLRKMAKNKQMRPSGHRAAASRKPSVRPNGGISKQISLPPQSIRPTRHRWFPVDSGRRDPEQGGEDSWLGKGNQTAAGLGTSRRWNSQAKGLPGLPLRPGPASSPGARCGSHFEGFGLDTGKSTIRPNPGSRIWKTN